MNDHDFSVLREAVNLSRNERILSVRGLEKRMAECGHSLEDIQKAIQTWKLYGKLHKGEME